MKNIKNNIDCDYDKSGKTFNKKKTHSLCRSIAEERLSFKEGAELGSLSIEIEDGATKRKIRRIVEKRVCKEYWKLRKNVVVSDNKHRAATMKYISSVTKKIFGQRARGFLYVAA